MRITAAQAQAWFDKTKLNIDSLDEHLLPEIETEVLARLGAAFDTSTWIDEPTTPRLVKTIISKLYAAYFYHRQYSEDTLDENTYAAKLEENAELLITGLIDGTIDLPEVVTSEPTGQPAFYPDDASSALEATADDRSLGPNVFSMGDVF